MYVAQKIQGFDLKKRTVPTTWEYYRQKWINIPNTDEWYIVYHRRPIPNLDRDNRVTCIDKLYFNEDGTIKNVKMIFDGVRRKLKGK